MATTPSVKTEVICIFGSEGGDLDMTSWSIHMLLERLCIAFVTSPIVYH